MSKYVQLMQRLEREGEPLNGRRVSPAGTLPPPALDEVTGAEIERLVDRIFFASEVDPNRAVVFVGVEPGAGCSWTCTHSAQALAARAPRLVCVVDANHRRPSQKAHFGIDGEVTLSASGVPEDGHGREHWLENLCLITHPPLDGSKLPEQESAIAQLRARFDYILVDAPAANVSKEARTLGRIADGVVLIVGANKTRRELALRVKQELEADGVRILGGVLNNRTFPVPDFLYRML